MQEYDPAKHKAAGSEDVAMTTTNQRGDSRQPQAPPTTGNYQEKYKHLLRGLECAEQSAVKMEPNKAFGYGEFVWTGPWTVHSLVPRPVADFIS